MVSAQVKQEPQLLHVHSVQGKTQTLNIVENATHKHSRKKTQPTRNQYARSHKSENTRDQTNLKTALHTKIRLQTTTTTTS